MLQLTRENIRTSLLSRLRSPVDIALFLLMMVSFIALGIIIYHTQTVGSLIADQSPYQDTMTRDQSALYTIRRENIRKLESFFAKHRSPLYPYARLIVEQAEEQGIDYRLLPAIAMNESTLCKNIHEQSYNCWGWGIYADRVTRFQSYEDAIRTITRGMRVNYYDKGMSSPSAIMKVYTPSSPDGVWAKKIEWAYREIDRQ